MPIVRNASGHAVYVQREQFRSERPISFFIDNPEEYEVRLNEARMRVLDAIRFASRPLWGRGMNHEVRINGSQIEDLTDFVDMHDRKRANKVRKQRQREAKQGLAPTEHRLRSPQHIGKRRRALFRHSDIPSGYFPRASRYELDRFVDLMRWYLIEAAIMEMYERHEIALLNNNWYVKVSVMDNHWPARRDRQHAHGSHSRIKWDDRSFHGRPRRDRKRALRVV